MNRFEWVDAASVDQALAAVTSDSVFKAGGVDLLDLMKDDISAPKRLVNIRNILALNEIREDEQGLHIGPLATLTEIAEHQIIQKKYPAIADAADRVATPQIRNTFARKIFIVAKKAGSIVSRRTVRTTITQFSITIPARLCIPPG
jgi:xanthine dehydrogenase YagS FAD-binding subunit